MSKNPLLIVFMSYPKFDEWDPILLVGSYSTSGILFY
jgi:hypothetical protein